MLRRTILAENRKNRAAALDRDSTPQHSYYHRSPLERPSPPRTDSSWRGGNNERAETINKLLHIVTKLESELDKVSAAHFKLEENHFALCAAVRHSAILMPEPQTRRHRYRSGCRLKKINCSSSHVVVSSDLNSELVNMGDEIDSDDYEDEDDDDEDDDKADDEENIVDVNQAVVEVEDEKEEKKMQECVGMLRSRLCRRCSMLSELPRQISPPSPNDANACATSTHETDFTSCPEVTLPKAVVSSSSVMVDNKIEQTTRKLCAALYVAETACNIPQRPPMLHITKNLNIGAAASAASVTATAAFLRRSSFFRETTSTPLASNLHEDTQEAKESRSRSARGATPLSAASTSSAQERRSNKVATLFPSKSFKENATSQWRRKSNDFVLKREEVVSDNNIYGESHRQQLV